MSVARSTKLLHSAISFCYLLIILYHSPTSTTYFVPLDMLSSTCPPTRSDVTSTYPSYCSTVFLLFRIHLSLSQQQDVLLLMSYHHIIIWILVFPPLISVFSVFPYQVTRDFSGFYLGAQLFYHGARCLLLNFT